MAKPTKGQLSLINQFAKEPLTEEDCYTHSFRLIGTRYIPSRYLKIDRSLLDIYLNDVRNGDVVQIADHSFGGWLNTNITLPFGRFYDGEIVKDGDEFHIDGSMYMKSGQKTYIQDFTTDDISEQLNAGTLDDSSVSISWGRSECSICGNDIRDWENCNHWPGATYKVNDEEVLCTVIAKPGDNDEGTMYENSLVCVGAYPDAGHLSAKEKTTKLTPIDNISDIKLADRDASVFCLLSANNAQFLVAQENEPDLIKLHDLYHKMYEDLPESWTMGELVKRHTEVVEKLTQFHTHTLTDALDGTLPVALKARSEKEGDGLDKDELNVSDDGDIILGDDQEAVIFDHAELHRVFDRIPVDFDVQLIELAVLGLQAKELEAMAEEGKLLRKELIDETIEWGVRAEGNDFNKESWLDVLSDRKIETIREFKKGFEKRAKDALNAGRVTETNVPKDTRGLRPAEAFKC